MIKFPKEIKQVIKAIEEKGFEAYAVGGCVRDCLLGKEPPDWDLAANAGQNQLLLIFPDAKVTSEKLGVININAGQGEGAIPVDIARYRIDGAYSDHRRPDDVVFVDKIEEDLARRDFTVNAMAANPEKGLIDLFSGRQDLHEKIIRTVGDPLARFEEDPLRIMRAVRFSAQLGFEIEEKTYAAVIKKRKLLSEISADRIRQEFEKILTSEFAGRGLKLLARTGLMNYIIGDLADWMSRRASGEFADLIENIDKTKRIRERRLGLFYTCFEGKDGLDAAKVLNYDAKTMAKIKDALELIEPLHLIATKLEFKKFVARYGMERYEYLDGLAKALHIVHDTSNAKAKTRYYIMEEIKYKNEPLLLSDLAVDGDDLIEFGVAKGERVGEILGILLDIVHQKPHCNRRDYLLARARECSENKIIAAVQRMRWLR